MKKYIFIIIFLSGFFLSFVSGYYADISINQTNLINNAIDNEEYNFFLKFNEYYDSEEEFINNNIVINKIYNQTLSYNVIIRNLSISDFIDSTSDDLTIIISSNLGSVEIDYSLESYFENSFYMFQVTNEEIKEECGDIITNISIKNDKYLYDYDVDININNHTLEQIKTKEVGFTQEEILEITTIKSFSSVIKMSLSFIGIYALGVAIYFALIWIYRNKL